MSYGINYEIETNNPPILVGDFWIAQDEEGKILRRIRVVARHPFRSNTWIYEEHPAKMKTGRMKYELSICPEFNLRYVFRPEPVSDE